MKRTLLTLAIASILATGCGHAAIATRAAESSVPRPSNVTAKADVKVDALAPAKDESGARDESAKTAPEGEKPVEKAKDDAPKAVPANARKPGDFVVYRFSGSFRKEPLTIAQRVIDRQGSILTVDITAESGDDKRELRVRLNDAADAKNEVVSVARIVGGVERPASPAAYDKLMAEAMLAADQNEAFLGAEDVVIDVNGTLIPCHKASYRVRVGKKAATLSTLSSDGFVWGDIGGDITTTSGKVLFRAEVVEAGHAEAGKGATVAKSNVAP